jgi:hypothetical protein
MRVGGHHILHPVILNEVKDLSREINILFVHIGSNLISTKY